MPPRRLAPIDPPPPLQYAPVRATNINWLAYAVGGAERRCNEEFIEKA